MQGLRFQDVKEISIWEILEGVKNSGPLMLSWFGAVHMKRKPLHCEEQWNLVRFHTHQNQSQNFISGPHTMKLLTEETVPTIPVNTPTDISKALTAPDSAQGDAHKQGVVPGAGTSTSGGVPFFSTKQKRKYFSWYARNVFQVHYYMPRLLFCWP